MLLRSIPRPGRKRGSEHPRRRADGEAKRFWSACKTCCAGSGVMKEESQSFRPGGVNFAPRLTDEIADALSLGRPVVALETTLVSHGFSAGRGLAAALGSEPGGRGAGATPATIGVVDGVVRVGLSVSELTRFADAGHSARKVG